MKKISLKNILKKTFNKKNKQVTKVKKKIKEKKGCNQKRRKNI